MKNMFMEEAFAQNTGGKATGNTGAVKSAKVGAAGVKAVKVGSKGLTSNLNTRNR